MTKWMKPNNVEWKTFIILLPGLLLILNYLLFEKRIWTNGRVWIFSMPVIAAVSLFSWYIHIVVMHWLRLKFPRWQQTTMRVIILAACHIFLAAITFTLFFVLYDYFNFLDYRFNSDNYFSALLLAIALTMIATTLWEADYIFSKWKEIIDEKEKLQQLNIMREFDSLKNQVNPHFLFNCFNALSSLIHEDKRQAEIFVDELSKVYRYLLKSNKDGLSTLENEIRFINSYYQLLQTRYGGGLQMQVEIDKRYLQYFIPSLTLQMLVENAVKHNVVLKRSPLVIDVFTAAGNLLVVNNNLQPRQSTSASKSGKVGLENISNKYHLMNLEGFQVMKDTKNFSVVCPLIWGQVAEKQALSLGLAAG